MRLWSNQFVLVSLIVITIVWWIVHFVLSFCGCVNVSIEGYDFDRFKLNRSNGSRKAGRTGCATSTWRLSASCTRRRCPTARAPQRRYASATGFVSSRPSPLPSTNGDRWPIAPSASSSVTSTTLLLCLPLSSKQRSCCAVNATGVSLMSFISIIKPWCGEYRRKVIRTPLVVLTSINRTVR